MLPQFPSVYTTAAFQHNTFLLGVSLSLSLLSLCASTRALTCVRFASIYLVRLLLVAASSVEPVDKRKSSLGGGSCGRSSATVALLPADGRVLSCARALLLLLFNLVVSLRCVVGVLLLLLLLLVVSLLLLLSC